MSIPTSSIAYFDRLPDEILLQILNDAMERDSPFFPEHCVQAGKEHPKLRAIKTHFLSSQYVHLDDWLFVNILSHRIRRLGREAFFRSKTIAMNSSLAERLRNGTFSAFGGARDQELVLRNIRSIILVDLTMYITSVFLQLPKTLRAFPNLERSTIMVGFRRQEPALLISKAERRQAPIELRRLLGNIGIDSEAVPEMALCKGLYWAELREMLTRDVYPALRVRGATMAKSNVME
ncbi:hypothetical protein F4678DRAFT_106900 [Xylaria arbuscula]|nr:hypothetical protein F4678DRAFT_106900 [Xylaria arbuscula]